MFFRALITKQIFVSSVTVFNMKADNTGESVFQFLVRYCCIKSGKNKGLDACNMVEFFDLGYCFTPYQRLLLYNGAPLVAFYDTLGIRRTYSRLKNWRFKTL